MSFQGKMKVDYSGKTVVITGASGAIGSAMAEAFAANGANVAIGCRNIKKGNEIAENIHAAGGIAKVFPLEVTDGEHLEKVAEEIEAEFGGIHVLVNNAGVNVGPEDRKPVYEFSDEKWSWIVGVDLDGTYKCSKAFIPYIMKAGGGNIINISSVVGMIPFRNQCAFTAAKAGVINLSKAMALELAPENIRVNVIAPGSIMFEGTKALFYNDKKRAEAMLSHIPQNRPGDPSDIANAALYVGSDDAASYLTGAVLTVDGGWTCGYARNF